MDSVRRTVEVGDVVRVLMPHSEVNMHMRIAGNVMSVKVLATGAQPMMGESAYCPAITHGEAGIHTEVDGSLYAYVVEPTTRVLNGNATVGYRLIMSDVRIDDIKHDPWGTAMSWLGAIGDVVYVLTGEAMPEYGPSPMVNQDNGREYITCEGGTGQDVLTMYDDGRVTIDDMRAAYTILNRFADWAERAGRSY